MVLINARMRSGLMKNCDDVGEAGKRNDWKWRMGMDESAVELELKNASLASSTTLLTTSTTTTTTATVTTLASAELTCLAYHCLTFSDSFGIMEKISLHSGSFGSLGAIGHRFYSWFFHFVLPHDLFCL